MASAARIEHVNHNVRDPDRAAAAIERIFGWSIRWAGPGRAGGRTVHVGSRDCYFALSTAGDRPYAEGDFPLGRPLNHVAIEVDDLDAVEARVVDAGFTPFAHGDYEPGRRFYFLDGDGVEFEVVSYA